LVVDNASQDRSLGLLRERAGIEVLPLSRNVGFCAAANRGVDRARQDAETEFFALLNNDVALDLNWHREAHAALCESDVYGSCATCLLRPDEPGRVDTAGITWTTPGWADNYLTGERAPQPGTPTHEVLGACAAAALYRREFFDTVGLFDEALFAYQEDVDLALRGQRVGWRCVCAPGAQGYHVGFGSNRRYPLGGTYADYYNARNRLTVLVKSLPAAEWRNGWKSIIAAYSRSLMRSIAERRFGAVFLGLAHAIVRLPGTLRARRSLADELQPRPPSGAGHHR
jgi:GT2 family glycosyltransferase